MVSEALHIIPIPAFADNYIWALRCGSQVAVVDPGDASSVIDYLEQTQGILTSILITHHHNDHFGGIHKLCQSVAESNVVNKTIAVFGPKAEKISGLTHLLKDGDEITLPGLNRSFAVIATPGHTLGHIVYYGSGKLFCGDTLFSAGCGRLFEGTAEQMFSSLDRLNGFEETCAMYPAHEYTLANLHFAATVEPDNKTIAARIQAVQALRRKNEPSVPTSLQLERETNPFLRCAVSAVKVSVSKHVGRTIDSEVEVFAALREWRNNFR